MTTNVPPEPDEFQTRMRQPASEGDVEDTNRSGALPAPAQPAAQQPQQAQPPFAPPGFGGASQPPAGYGAPQQAQQPQGQQPPSPFGQPTQSFGQQSQAPQQQPWGQQAQQPSTGGGYGQQPPSGGGYGQQPPGGGFGQGGFAQQQPQPGWAGPQKPRDANPLKAAFDFSFGTYATPGIVKIVYGVGIVLAVLWYVFIIVGGFQLGAPRDYGFGIETPGTAVPGILAIVLGWIPAAFSILLLRLALEQVLSSVRTATDVRVLRERSDADTTD